MNEQEIQELLQRYFDGATSLDEERELRRCFAGKDIPGPLEVYRPMFAFFAEEQAVEPPAQKTAARAMRLNRIIIAGVAASVAILLLVGPPKAHDQYARYVDGQRVYDETAAVESAGNKLQMLAASMQKARSGMAAFGKVRESNRSLQQFGKISSAYRQVEEAGSKFHEAVSGIEN